VTSKVIKELKTHISTEDVDLVDQVFIVNLFVSKSSNC